MSAKPVVQRLRAHYRQGSTDAPNLLILDNVPQRPPLYLLIDTSGGDALVVRLVSAAADAYRKSTGSLTGALQRVVRAAAEALLQAPPDQQASCGLTAVLIAKDHALIAQVEPSVCWLLRDGRLTRLPSQSVWLDGETSDETVWHMPGGLARFAPDLTRIALQRDDRLLFATVSVARDIGELLIAQAMAEPNPCAALHRLAPDIDFTVLSIEPRVSVAPALAEAPPLPTAPPSTDVRLPKAQTPKPYATARSAVGAHMRAAQGKPAAKPSTGAQPAPTQHPHAFQQARKPGGAPAFRLPRISVRSYLEVVVVTVLFIFKFLWMLVGTALRFLSRALPEREARVSGSAAQARRSVMQSNPLESRVLVAVALAIPLLVVLSILVMRGQSDAARNTRATDLIANATSAYQSALSLQNPDAKRAELVKAGQMLEEALGLAPRDASAKELQAKISLELDKLSNAVTFFFYPMLYDFRDKDSHPSAVIARGIDVYVLDTGLHRLYKFLLNETKDQLQATPTRSAAGAPTPNPVVMRQGDERDKIVIGQMADIFWATAGGGRSGAGVLTLTAQKQVVEYLPAKGIGVLELGAASGWQEATLGESFNGNLYLLDAKANRILKYQPTGEHYKNAPSDYVTPKQSVDFAGAVDMAIDGFVWVLLADGTIMKFDAGNLLPFDKKGLDTPLRKPVALIAPPNSQYVWVADAGNRRIVQFTKSGEYLRQLKSDDPSVMSDLRGLAVDERSQRFYFVNGNKLYLGTLQN